jgi:hypothetical protein
MDRSAVVPAPLWFELRNCLSSTNGGRRLDVQADAPDATTIGLSSQI